MKNYFLFIISFILLYSCTHIEENAQPDYTPMSIGNYWVYKYFKIEPSGEEFELSMIDSIYINKDTILNGNLYYSFKGDLYTGVPNSINENSTLYLRDSLSYLVNNRGSLYFSSEDFSDIFNDCVQVMNSDTIYTGSTVMEPISGMVNVPSGIYEDVLNVKKTFIINEPLNGIPSTRYCNTYYAPDIGKILETQLYMASPNVYERRLIRYNIQ